MFLPPHLASAARSFFAFAEKLNAGITLTSAALEFGDFLLSICFHDLTNRMQDVPEERVEQFEQGGRMAST